MHPGLVAIPPPGGVSAAVANPLGVPSLGPVLSTVLIGTINGLSVVFTVFAAVSFASMVIRYRSGGHEVRQQIKWLACAAVAAVACQIVALLTIAFHHLTNTAVTGAAYGALTVVVLFGFPATITLAILRYRLYEIDRIISRTLAYAIVSGVLVGLYAGLVLLATPLYAAS